jgi:hypothetical protein
MNEWRIFKGKKDIGLFVAKDEGAAREMAEKKGVIRAGERVNVVPNQGKRAALEPRAHDEVRTPEHLQELLDAARAHGQEDDPEHEVGDLQQILMSCWERLSAKDRFAVYREYADLVEVWGSGG